jgi:hypothetical protein
MKCGQFEKKVVSIRNNSSSSEQAPDSTAPKRNPDDHEKEKCKATFKRNLSKSKFADNFPRPLLARFVEYTSSLSYADKVVKILGYGLGTLCGVGRTVLTNGNTLQGLQKLATEIGRARMVYRTIQIGSSTNAILSGSNCGKWTNPLIYRLQQAIEISNVLYVLTEHWAWARAKAPSIVTAPMTDEMLWAFNGIFWLAYCVFELWMDLLTMRELNEKEALLKAGMEAEPDFDDAQVEADLEEICKSKRSVRWQLLRFVLYLPNAYHWALEKGCFPRGFVAGLAFAEAVVGVVCTFPEK